MKIHIVQHNDADGYSAAYLVYKYLKLLNLEIKYWVANYDEKLIDEFLDEVKEDDRVYIVDYSIEPDKMIKLLKITKNVTWIDHHRTAINKYKEWKDLIKEATRVKSIPGIRLEGLCGAALTYLYLFKIEYINLEVNPRNLEEYHIEGLKEIFSQYAPYWLKLVNDWDVWDHKFSPDSKQLQIATQGDLSIELYEELDNDKFEDKLTEYLHKGESYLEYRDIWARQFRERYGYSKLVTWFGETYSVYFLNSGNLNSEYFGPEIFNHDICCNYCSNGKIATVSLYSQTPGIDCGAIARKFGGGGHPGAAGFSVSLEKTELIFNE